MDPNRFRTYGEYKRHRDRSQGHPNDEEIRVGGKENHYRRTYHDADGAGEPLAKRSKENTEKEAETDDSFQPAMMTFKAFLDTQDDSITDEDALVKYGEYKQEFRRQQVKEFFVKRKEEEWFYDKYHPNAVTARLEDKALRIKRRMEAFVKLDELTNGFQALCLQEGNVNVVKMLDATVILLEGGSEDDIKAMDEDADSQECLHKTTSLLLKNIPCSVKEEELEAVCKKFPGFKRLLLSEPTPETDWVRRGWATFARSSKIKEICFSMSSLMIKDHALCPLVNRDLSQRTKSVPYLTSDQKVVRQHIRLAGNLIIKLDKKRKLWDAPEENVPGTNGLCSNPLLAHIQDFLVEEASAEEEELLGLHGLSNGSDLVTITKDDQLIHVLDKLILYLRIVHSFDFYAGIEYKTEDKMPNRCGIISVRSGAAQESVSAKDIDKYMEEFERKLKAVPVDDALLSDEEVSVLGAKLEEDEVEKFVQDHTQQLSEEKFLCTLSNKKFKGAEFVRKHIFNKHMDKVDLVKAEVQYFNNYLKDPQRPQLPVRMSKPPKSNTKENRVSVRDRLTFANSGPRDRSQPYPERRHKGSVKERLGFRSPIAQQLVQEAAAAEPRAAIDYSDVDF